jgi:hypothetical protein
MQKEIEKPMEVKSDTGKVVVVDLNNKDVCWQNMQEYNVEDGVPRVARVYKDHLELDIDNGISGKKKTLHFYYHDIIAINRVLFRIHCPKIEAKE